MDVLEAHPITLLNVPGMTGIMRHYLFIQSGVFNEVFFFNFQYFNTY